MEKINKEQFLNDLSLVCDLSLKAVGLQAKQAVDRLQAAINIIFAEEKVKEEKKDES